MTSQIPDTFLYNGEEYQLVALAGEGLITPQDYGMQPQMLETACYRGFYSTYEITDEGLFLTQMVIGEVKGRHKPIQGVMPSIPSGDRYGYPTYQGLRLLTPFTGKMRLGKDFIRDLYVRMGYQKGSAFETLLEFSFEAGRLLSVQDISAENSQKRGTFKERFETGELVQSIDEAFSLDMDIE
ncbi:hypothetical protein H6G94_35690 [Nostoc punctiforme FACHB-252]|uniref:Uncharacterized protein n=1 Tax=Nostoc punctiforme FACHB-252 TaxID=1357509 RepID=A0ABR8HLL7_NOSPU|nr:hypothetical protein [Nostoc punctiforme]MBD2616502.1 hypothetical protein [Nostoc punctiforme FACHB-252]